MAISKVIYPPSKRELAKIDSLQLSPRNRRKRISEVTRVRWRVQIRSVKLLEPVDLHFDSYEDAIGHEQKVKTQLRSGELLKQQEKELAQEFCPIIEEMLELYVEKKAIKLKGFLSEKVRALTTIPRTLISRQRLLDYRYVDITFFKGFYTGEIPEWKNLEDVPFGQFYTNAINPDVVRLYKEARVKQGISENTIRREFSTLAQAYNHFRDLFDHIPYNSDHFPRVNPFHNLPQNLLSGKPAPRKKCLTTKEENALIDALVKGRSEQLEIVVRTALSSGMRRGEIIGLTWAHINLNDKTFYLPDTKTGKPRTVPILDPTVLQWLEANKQSSGKVFDYTVAGLKSSFNRLLIRANLSGVVRFHDFRRTFISRLATLNNSLFVAEIANTKASEVEKINEENRIHKIIEKLKKRVALSAQEISILVGHSSVDMSQHYTDIGPKF